MVRIAVIGAGVNGLSSALNIQQTFPNAKVTIIAEQFGSELVSHGAGGLFRPDLEPFLGHHNADVLKQCVRDSWKWFSSLAMSEKAGESGHMLIGGWMVYSRPKDAGYETMKECAFDFHQVPASELQRRRIPFKYGYSCISVISQPPIYLEWMMTQFKLKGGLVQKRTLKNIEELYGDYELVINCCGLKALSLLEDKKCQPIRGQLVMVRAPWIKQFYYSEVDVYLIPHNDHIIIGGIRIPGDASTVADPHVADTIVKNAEAVFPELKGAERVSTWAGSRPGRSEIRLETEIMDFGNNRKLPVVHNYGHGGHGVTLSWGTGVHVAKLAKQALSSMPKSLL